MDQDDDLNQKIQQICKRYQNSNNAELEIRFQNITKGLALNIISKCEKLVKGEETFTLNIINNTKQKNYITTFYYDSTGKRIKVDSSSKAIIDEVLLKNDFTTSKKIKEEKSEHISTDRNSLLRFKKRYGFKIIPHWRVDITCVKQFLGIEAESEAGKYKKMLLKDWDDLDANLKWEVEIEHLTTRKEEVDNETIFKVINKVMQLMDKSYIETSIFHEQMFLLAQKLLIGSNPSYIEKFKKFGLKQLLPKVVGLSKVLYGGIYPCVGFFITDKADGERTVLAGSGKRIFAINKEIVEFIDKSEKPLTSNPSTFSFDAPFIIADTEFINGKYYIFDVMYWGDNKIGLPFEERISFIPKICEMFPFVKSKTFIQVQEETAANDIEKAFKIKSPYPTNGLIFIKPGNTYMKTLSYKWKPREKQTIDFLVEEKEGEFILCCGIQYEKAVKLGLKPEIKDKYVKIKFSPSIFPEAWRFDPTLVKGQTPEMIRKQAVGHICEMIFQGFKDNKPIWYLERVRRDRDIELGSNYYGNDYRVAEMIWHEYYDPFVKKELINGPVIYFSKFKDSIYRAQTKYITNMKHVYIKRLGSKKVIDIGIGKGQDLEKYFINHVNVLMCIDYDHGAIAELIHRKHEYVKLFKSNSIKIFVQQMDVNDPWKKNVEKIHSIYKYPFNVAVCNLAAHYFVNNTRDMDNFIAFVVNNLIEGGEFQLTVLDGELIYNKLKDLEKGEKWIILEDGIQKFIIQKEFTGSFELTGQKIKVKLPFSEELVEENLFNIDGFAQRCKNRGLEMKSKYDFMGSSLKYCIENVKIGELLTKQDKEWISLFKRVIFTRTHFNP